MRARFVCEKIRDDVDACSTKHVDPASLVPRMGIHQGNVDRADATRDHLLCTRGRALMKRARLERHECDDVIQVADQLSQRHGLRVRLVRWLSKSASDDEIAPNQHTSDRRIWTAVGECLLALLDGFSHEGAQQLVGFGLGRQG